MADIVRKEDRVIITMRNEDDSFARKIRIPTDMWPLNRPDYEFFGPDETVPITDETVIRCFDKADQKMGFCYPNVKNVVNECYKHGIEVIPYVGWYVYTSYLYPVHHCWSVLKHPNGDASVLDYGDTFTKGCEIFPKLKSPDSIDESRALLIKLHHMMDEGNLHEFCGNPFGKVGFGFYIGCPCDPDEGIKIYQDLVNRYPDHPILGTINRETGASRIQEMYYGM